MKTIVATAVSLVLSATAGMAQTAAPASGLASPAPAASPVVPRPTKVKKNRRYGGGTPVTAGSPNGVRINSVGEVLFDEP